jgi:hypothetical protein
MEIINREAAALPGSAEDYVEVFRTALPAAMSAGFSSVEQIAHFTDQMTAIASANQENSQEAAMDMSRLLQGRAGAEVRLWRTLQPLIGKSAEEFNRMSAPQRAAAMQGAIHRYSDTLSHMGNTWEAISGTTSQYLVQMTRAATQPLFSYAKDELSKVNDWLARNQERIQQIGATISTFMVDRIDAARERVVELYDTFHDGAARLVSFGRAHAGAIARVGAGLALGPLGGAAVGGMMSAAHNHPDVLAAAGDRITAMFQQLGRAIEPLSRIGEAMSSIWGELIAGALPGLVDGFTRVGAGVSEFITNVSGPLSSAMSTLANVAAGPLGEAFGNIASALGGLFHDALVNAAGLIGEFAHVFANVALNIQNAFDWLHSHGATTPGAVQDPRIATLHAVGDWMHRHGAGQTMEDFERAEQERSITPEMRRAAESGWASQQAADQARDRETNAMNAMATSATGWGEEFDHQTRQARRLRPLHNPPNQRGGAHTTNDFRHSRFEIMQKFAEGFDPDRIAVAFSHDLERTAERRLSGQLEPQFTTR